MMLLSILRGLGFASQAEANKASPPAKPRGAKSAAARGITAESSPDPLTGSDRRHLVKAATRKTDRPASSAKAPARAGAAKTAVPAKKAASPSAVAPAKTSRTTAKASVKATSTPKVTPKVPPKVAKTPSKAPAKAAAQVVTKAKAVKAASAPVVAKAGGKTPPKAAAKPQTKVAPAKVGTAVASKKATVPAPKAKAVASKPMAQAAKASVSAKAAPAKAVATAKKSSPAVSGKATPSNKSPATAAAPQAKRPATPAAAPAAVKVSKTQAAAPAVAPAPPAKPATVQSPASSLPKVGATIDTPVPMGKRAARKVMMEQMSQPEVQPTHAPDAAKATFSAAKERVVNMPTAHAIAVKKDPKRADNWKKLSLDALCDADILSMPDSEYMNDVQLAYFRRKLSGLRDDMLANAGETTEHLREDTAVVPDPADRATIEEEHALELRTRDRERKLLKKIEQSLARIDANDYGYCDETGEAIGVARLLARPTASLSLEAQQRRELKQKMFGD